MNDVRVHYCCKCNADIRRAERCEEHARASSRHRCVEDEVLLALFDARSCSTTTRRNEEHAKRARRDGLARIVGRYAKDKIYAHRMGLNGARKETMQEWGVVYRERATSRLPVHSIPCRQTQWNYARCDCRSTQVGDQNTAPRHWNYEELLYLPSLGQASSS